MYECAERHEGNGTPTPFLSRCGLGAGGVTTDGSRGSFLLSTTTTESCLPSCLSDAGVDDLTSTQLGSGAGEG